MDAKELKPCPFCGGKAITHGGARHIHCGNEHCTMTNVWAKAETAELASQCWNTRAHDSDAAQVPQGWKLVPIEPTETMVVNGFESWPDEFFSSPEDWEAFEKMSGCQQAAHKAKLCYRAMLAAAPAIPQAAGDAAQAPVAWANVKEDGVIVGLSQHQEDIANWQNPQPLFYGAPVSSAAAAPLTREASDE